MTSPSMQTAALALHLGLLTSAQYQELDESAKAGEDPCDLMTARGWLQASDVSHLKHVLERCLTSGTPDWLEPTLEPIGGFPTWDATPPPPIGSSKEPATPLGTLATSYRRFRIQQLHATGGIGRVWIAHDDALGRQVALKDLRPELSKPGHQVRFVEEAKITARLEHPGIVPVYELARGDDGQPFYVMRFVKGRTLQDAIARFHEARQAKQAQPLEFLRLIDAFRAISQTVAYAHAQGVLHRDLKPANILLGDFGEVLVLDWGLAKAGKSSASADTAGENALDTFDQRGSGTQAGQILGTPSYMSPEQGAGQIDAIDTRSDVWGLGAILYEILTGAPPFRADALDELLRKLKEDPPARPRSLNRDAPAALEAVCLKALAKQPADRYASASLLAEEIQRFLADEPVEARREPITQRIARWTRRHRAFVTGAAALLVTAVVALAISTVLVGRQHARAEANLEKALNAVETFYVHVSENRLLDEDGMQPLRADLLRDAVRYGEEFAAENEHDPRRQAALARFHLLLGKVLAQTDEPVRALEKLEQARTLYAALRAQAPQSAEYLRGEALVELNIGVACRVSDPQRARHAYEAARDRFEQLLEKDAESPVDREKLALALNNLGHHYRQQDQFDKALALYRSALTNSELLAKNGADNRVHRHDRAGILSNIGAVLLDTGKLDEARKVIERAVDIRQDLVRAKMKDLWLEEQLAGSQNLLGNLCLQEDAKKAELHFREALRLRRIVACRNPAVPRYRKLLAGDYYNIGRSLRKQSRQPAALTELGHAIDEIKQYREEAPKDVEAVFFHGRVVYVIGLCHTELKDAKAAAAAYTQTIAWLQQARKLDPTQGRKDLMNAYWSRGQTRNLLKDYAGAVLDYDSALEVADAAKRDEIAKERAEVVRKRDSKK